MAEAIAARTERLFNDSWAFTKADWDRIFAEHSVAGRLRSGMTVTRATKAFAEQSCKALDESLNSVAARVENRGCQWRKMIGDVDKAIDRHMDRAPSFFEAELRVAGPDSLKLATPALDEIRSDLHQRLADFREGWTAPRAKPWRERNALLYAIILLVLGALVSEGGKALIALKDSPRASTPPTPHQSP